MSSGTPGLSSSLPDPRRHTPVHAAASRARPLAVPLPVGLACRRPPAPPPPGPNSRREGGPVLPPPQHPPAHRGATPHGHPGGITTTRPVGGEEGMRAPIFHLGSRAPCPDPAPSPLPAAPSPDPVSPGGIARREHGESRASYTWPADVEHTFLWIPDISFPLSFRFP